MHTLHFPPGLLEPDGTGLGCVRHEPLSSRALRSCSQSRSRRSRLAANRSSSRRAGSARPASESRGRPAGSWAKRWGCLAHPAPRTLAPRARDWPHQALGGWAAVLWRVNIWDFVHCSRDNKHITKKEIHSSPQQTQSQTLKMIPKPENKTYLNLIVDAFPTNLKTQPRPLCSAGQRKTSVSLSCSNMPRGWV